VAGLVNINEIYFIWRHRTRIIRNDPDYELPLKFRGEFEKQILKEKIQTFPRIMIRKLCADAVINKNGTLIVSITKWAEILQKKVPSRDSKNFPETIYVENNPPRRKRRYVVTDQYSDGAIPYGMVNQPPTGGIAKKDLG